MEKSPRTRSVVGDQRKQAVACFIEIYVPLFRFPFHMESSFDYGAVFSNGPGLPVDRCIFLSISTSVTMNPTHGPAVLSMALLLYLSRPPGCETSIF
jgi:hypothetical protein